MSLKCLCSLFDNAEQLFLKILYLTGSEKQPPADVDGFADPPPLNPAPYRAGMNAYILAKLTNTRYF